MLTYENFIKSLNEQEDEILVKIHRDTYFQSDKWVQMDEQGHIISENEAKGTLLFLSDLAVWLQTFKFKDIKELESYIKRYKEEK